MRNIYIILVIIALNCSNILAQQNSELSNEDYETLLADSVKGKKGVIHFPKERFEIRTPDGFVYLDKEQSNHLLTDYWNNRSDSDLLGVLLPDTVDIYIKADIAYVIYYDAAGYVSDKDADEIDYNNLLDRLKNFTKEQNIKEGTDWQLIGWADQPFYDKNRKALHWAKHLHSDKEKNDWMNYDLRVLGKDGFVVIQAVCGMDFHANIKQQVSSIIDSVFFDQGYTYEDFNPDHDHFAEWTLGGLIAGKVLAKAGILAKLSVFFIKFWKLIIVGVVTVLTAIFKLFKKEG